MNVFEIKMQDNDASAATVGDYLKALLLGIWREGESFSGKRPFGNSGWEHEIYTALVTAGAVEGSTDEEGWLEDVNEAEANKLIERAIAQAFDSHQAVKAN